MLFGNRGRRSSGKRRRKSEAFRPRGEALEVKALMAQLLLGAGTPFNLAGQQTTAPNGPQTLGGQLPFIADSFGFNPQTQGTQTTDPGLGVLESGNGSVASQGIGYNVAAVGDMNLDGSNDFLVGAPGVTRTGTVISPETGNPSQAFLVFGNRSVTLPTTQSWLSSTPEQRVGVINALGQGTVAQFNPFTNRNSPFAYNFDGIIFQTNSFPNSGLGTFVAQAGPNAFVIGAPNYGGTGVGRLYYITATSNFNQSALRSAPVNLDDPTNPLYSGLTIVTFKEGADPGTVSGLGTSFADMPNLFGQGLDNLIIGEPGASLNNKTGNGGVFVFQATSLPLTPGADNVVDVRSQSQLTFAGANSGDAAGFSVANAGDVNGATLGAFPINDLLIGAPNFNNNAGAAYLVYGGTTLSSGVKNGLVDLSRLQITPIPTGSNADPTPPQGAVFVGSGTDRAGFTVSGAGNFNAGVDTLNDFMIGSPGANGSTGRVNLFYGVNTGAINSTGQYTAGLIANATNPIALNNPSAALNLTGVSPLNAQFVGSTSGERAGFSLSYYATSSASQSVVLIGSPGWNGGQGAANELLGPSTGTFQQTVALENSSIMRWYTLTFPTTFQSSDAIGFGNSVSAFPTGNGDFIAGAPGYTGTLPTSTSTPPTPLVGAAAMVLAALQPSGTLPSLTGTGGGGGGGGGGGTSGGFVTSPVPPGLFSPPDFVPPLGTNFVPTVVSLSTFNYAPIPLNVALQGYLPPDGFSQRFYAYHHPGKGLAPMLAGRGQLRSTHTYAPNGVATLGTKVFTRGRFHPGNTYQWTHRAHGNPARVVPSSLLRQKYTSQGNPLGKV